MSVWSLSPPAQGKNVFYLRLGRGIMVLRGRLMRRALLICCIVALALIGLSCTPEEALDISVTEIPDGIVIENTGTADCIVFVTSHEGK